MERDKLAGTLILWPGVAEELVATKAWYVREGLFKNVDVCLFAHVGNNLNVSWGTGGGTGLMSVEYTFQGETAHSAGAERPRQEGLAVKLAPLGQPTPPENNTGGGSGDIGDVSWNVPTVTLRYPSNIPGLPGHNWSSAIASATPIAHKGVVAGAKVQAMTVLDLLTKPEIVKAAWDVSRAARDSVSDGSDGRHTAEAAVVR